MYVRGYLQGSENGRVVTIAESEYYILRKKQIFSKNYCEVISG
jgi:hypothetical protein